MTSRQVSLAVFLLLTIIHELTATVQINDFPRILTRTHNQTINVSDTAILTCHVTNLGNHHVTWLKYDRNTSIFLPLTVGEEVFLSEKRYSVSSYSISSVHSYWNLEIYNTQLADDGTYECKISNRRRSVSIKIHLHVQIPMSIQPSRLYVEPGSEVELDCMIYNINTSSITWHFSSSNQTYHYNDYLYDIHEKYQHEKNISTSQLIIRHAQPYHSGLWTCTYRRQRRSARIVVVKGAMQRLLSNNRSTSNVQCTMSLILFALLLGHHITRRI
ncbi:hypothetical protein I4U23_013691 [Adineta vaga]|nr:hypothetical protein I4U23_013691 [Adineta vaga]